MRGKLLYKILAIVTFVSRGAALSRVIQQAVDPEIGVWNAFHQKFLIDIAKAGMKRHSRDGTAILNIFNKVFGTLSIFT